MPSGLPGLSCSAAAATARTATRIDRARAPRPRQRRRPIGTRITAALIVRDEERFLAGCLASLAGRVDEIVVADTGSADRSRAIALEHGARLIEHRWADLVEMSYQAIGYRRVKNPRIWSMHDIAELTRGARR